MLFQIVLEDFFKLLDDILTLLAPSIKMPKSDIGNNYSFSK